MRRSLAVPLLIVAALLVPTLAYAGFAANREPLVIPLEAMRAGDVYRHEYRTEDDGVRFLSTHLTAYEGVARIFDRFGREVEADVTRTEDYEESGLQSAERCYSLVGGRHSVRRDLLADNRQATFSGTVPASSGFSPLGGGGASMRMENSTSVFWGGSCGEFALPLATPLREGDRVAFATIIAFEEDAPWAASLSLPASRTTFHGRDALLLRYHLQDVFPEEDFPSGDDVRLDSGLDFVYAVGIPVLASAHGWMEAASPNEPPVTESFRLELSGWTRGDGAMRSPDVGRQMEAPPFDGVAYDRISLDDSAFGLAYPFTQAFRDLSADPRLEVAAWLAGHPEAALITASYDSSRKHPTIPGETDGGWLLVWADSESLLQATVTRARAPSALPVLPISPLVDAHAFTSTGQWFTVASFPSEVLSSAAITRSAPVFGIHVAEIAQINYQTGGIDGQMWAALSISDVPETATGRVEGLTLSFHMLDGGLLAISDTVQENTGNSLGPLAGQGSVGSSRGTLSAFSALVGPVPGAGLAGGAAAATGIALLLVALKFGLLPFFTRLTRARLLDHPVRVRLFERVRAEPGIRLAELIEFASVGEGAARRHIDELRKHRFVVELREGGTVAYYVAGDVPPERARQAAVLRSESTRRVYDMLCAEPMLSLRDIAARLDMSAPGVHRIKKKLEAAGLLPAAPEATLTLK